MKQRIISIAAALALCLGLLPGTARAAAGDAGAVTITNADGSSSVTMEAGIKYTDLPWTNGGGIQEVADQVNPGSSYLVYADGVLTAYGNNVIYGTVSIASDLKMEGCVDLCGRAGPALRLNGHTLTLSDGVRLQAHNQSVDSIPASANNCVFENGTIVGLGNGVEIEINNHTTAAAVKDLTIKNVPNVQITGKTESGGVVENLKLENCGATILQRHESNTTIVEAGQITTDRLVSLGTLKVNGDHTETITPTGLVTEDGKIWADGGALTPYGAHFIDSSVTTPAAYRAGAGWALYTPGDNDTDTPAKLTLDGASYNGTINIRQADSVQLELKGENEVKSVNATAMTLTGNGSFQGTLEAQDFTNHSTATLNAVVKVTVLEEGTGIPKSISQTVYGNRSTSDLSGGQGIVQENAPITITSGATLTVPPNGVITILDLQGLKNHGTIVNGGTIQISLTEKPQGTPDFGTVVNNGGVTIYPTVDITGEEMSAFIKGLKLTGTGLVTVEKANPSGGDAVTDTYTNSGTKLLTPAGTDGALNLSSAEATDANWANQGYKWTDVQKDAVSGAITSAKLTLALGFNATSVTLPDATVTIVTEGESSIGTLTPPGGPTNAHADKLKLTFSGTGPLTITEHVEISGGSGNIITVDAGAKVTANNGISIGASGGIDSTITVNGTLTAAQGTGTSAIYGGKMAIGNTGVLEVSGTNGVQLNGMTGDFSDLFTVDGNGRFTADCSKYNIRVNFTNANDLPKDENGDPDVKAVINLGDEYMPDDCEPRLNDNPKVIDLIRKSTNEVYSGPLTIHKNHIWETRWTDGGGDTHHHACIYPGCTEKKDVTPHFYAHGSTACRDCNHARPAGTPDSVDNSGGGSGGGSDRDDSYTVTVERATHGTVTSDRRTASRGDTVTLTVTADSGYAIDTLTVTDSRGNEIELTQKGGGVYTFTMPGRAVTVSAAFISSACTGGADCPSRAFSDLNTGKWYHEAVDYVLENGLMDGYGSGLFGPNDTLSRAQFVQILYNRAGRPAAAGGSPFADVPSGAWYAPAVTWAASEGIVEGRGDGTFGPREPVTREQLAVMLWRYAGSPAASGSVPDFSDADRVSGYAREAVRWAVEQGILQGRGGDILAPRGEATRAEVAALFMRYLSR